MKTKFFTLVKVGLELKGVADMPLILDEGLSDLMKREDGEIIPIGNKLGADLESTYLRVTKSRIEVITPKFVIRYSLISRGLEYEFNPETENREEPFSSEFKVSWSSSVYVRERNQESPTRTYSARLSYNEKKGLQLYVGIDKKDDKEEGVLMSNSFITVIVDELIRELKSMNFISELRDWVRS